MPADGVVQIAFDRYLIPITVSRQSVGIVTAGGLPLPQEQAPNVLYDPVARTVTLARPALDRPWLEPGVPYKVRFALPKGDDDTIGLRAIDGATLATDQPLEYVFFVGQATSTPRSLAATLGEPESVSFCRDVLPIFQGKCSAGKCHGEGGAPAASLVLETPSGVRTTALNRIAQGSNTGALAGQPRAENLQFGVDMPIVDVDLGTSPPVGSPGNSWLLYKIDMPAPPSASLPRDRWTCPASIPTPGQEKPVTPLAPITPDADGAERARLANLVLGMPMPYPVLGTPAGWDEQALTFQERETIRMWIARGAETPDCGTCGFVQAK